jgi:hypothetical protein
MQILKYIIILKDEKMEEMQEIQQRQQRQQMQSWEIDPHEIEFIEELGSGTKFYHSMNYQPLLLPIKVHLEWFIKPIGEMHYVL